MKVSVFLAHIKSAERQTGISLSELLAKAKKLGIEAVDVNIDSLTDEEITLIKSSGLKISCVCKHCDIIHSDDIREIESAVLFAKEHNTKLMLIPGLINDGESKADATAKIIERLKPVVEKAEKTGVKICMEFFDSEKSPYSNGEELWTYLENIPSLGCTFDVGNLAAAGDDVSEWLDKMKDRIVHFHFKDKTYNESELTTTNPKILYDGQPLYGIATGYGILPMREIAEKAEAWGYDGYYTIEVFDAKNMWLCIEKAAEWFRSLGNKPQ